MDNSTENNKSFTEKIWITVGIVALAGSLLLIVKTSIRVLLLVFAGILIAVFFRGLSGLIQRKTGWNEKLCVVIAILLTLTLLAGFMWLLGAKVQAQLSELMETLPETIDNARQSIRETHAGKKAIDELSSEDTVSGIKETAGSFFASTFGVLGDLYVILFIGIFMTVSPGLYINGVVKLVPQRGREKAGSLLSEMGRMLRKWLKGKLLSMLVVAVLTAIGLAIIGVPLWLVLALFAGLVSFIPNFGPIIALIPAVLVGFMEGTTTALLVVGLYVLIQFIESNFITTTIQKKMVSLPPAMIMIAQLVMGALTGGWGLVLATPVMLVLIIVVQQLYVNKMDSQK
jgi:predicted PurR-regulated permease PerM